MSLPELVRASLFVTAVLLVYVLAAEIVIRRWLIGGRVPGRLTTPRQAAYQGIVIGMATLGLMCMAYARWIEPAWLEVTRIQVVSPKLPSGVPPIRVVQISDVHSDARARLETHLPAVVKAQKPDFIVFTGDAANQPAGVPIFRTLLENLAAIASTYVVAGNWDTAAPWRDELFGKTGAVELVGAAKRITIHGVDLWIAGAPFDRPDLIKPMLESIPPGAFTILLYHTPDLVESLEPGKVNLYCAGHTHGGQVALPFYGALITFSKFGKKYESGLFHVGGTALYVNRGIGMEGGLNPRVRFCARPELTVFEISGLR